MSKTKTKKSKTVKPAIIQSIPVEEQHKNDGDSSIPVPETEPVSDEVIPAEPEADVAPQEPTPGIIEKAEEDLAVKSQPVVESHIEPHPRDEQRIGAGYANGTRQAN